MKQHENTGMGKKRNSRSSSLQPKKDSLFPADLSKIDENKEVTADDLKLGLSIGSASSSKLHRPSEVSIVSNFGETDYLQLHRCEKGLLLTNNNFQSYSNKRFLLNFTELTMQTSNFAISIFIKLAFSVQSRHYRIASLSSNFASKPTKVNRNAINISIP